MKRIKKIIITLLIFVVAFFGVNFCVKYTSNKTCYKNIHNIPNCKVGIIFGAGIIKTKPSIQLQSRLDAGINLYRNNKIQKIILSGDNGEDGADEITVMRNYCVNNGIDNSDIFIDYAGYDTYSTMYRAKHVFNLDTVILITQNYHLDRAVFLGNMFKIKTYGFIADREMNNNSAKYTRREFFAVIKSIFDLVRHRKPKYYKEKININGTSNFSQKKIDLLIYN